MEARGGTDVQVVRFTRVLGGCFVSLRTDENEQLYQRKSVTTAVFCGPLVFWIVSPVTIFWILTKWFLNQFTIYICHNFRFECVFFSFPVKLWCFRVPPLRPTSDAHARVARLSGLLSSCGAAEKRTRTCSRNLPPLPPSPLPPLDSLPTRKSPARCLPRRPPFFSGPRVIPSTSPIRVWVGGCCVGLWVFVGDSVFIGRGVSVSVCVCVKWAPASATLCATWNTWGTWDPVEPSGANWKWSGFFKRQVGQVGRFQTANTAACPLWMDINVPVPLVPELIFRFLPSPTPFPPEKAPRGVIHALKHARRG